jgi:predicted nucleic acid-binding protein
MRYHLDTDFLVYALSSSGPERRRLRTLADSDVEIGMSAVAWYEFCRGPRTPEQLAVARSFVGVDGIAGFSEEVASRAADAFRSLGSPRKRAADVAIGVTAVAHEAVLLTRNRRDFAGIPGLTLETAEADRTGRKPDPG